MQKYRKPLESTYSKKYTRAQIFRLSCLQNPSQNSREFCSYLALINARKYNYIFTGHDIFNLNRNCNAKISETIALECTCSK
jgi:hypothetical protein